MTRQDFEAIVSAPPYERAVTRWAEDTDVAWPGHYRDPVVQFAWDVLNTVLREKL